MVWDVMRMICTLVALVLVVLCWRSLWRTRRELQATARALQELVALQEQRELNRVTLQGRVDFLWARGVGR